MSSHHGDAPTKLSAGYIGLGAMGWPMAEHLHKAGFLAGVWNRSGDKSKEFAAKTGCFAATAPGELASRVDVLFLNVSADADVLAVVHALKSKLKPGSIIVDNSTVSPSCAQQIAAELAEIGVHFLDAPVSGGVEGAKHARLSLMIGGDAAVLERVRPMLEVIGARITHMGEVGQGQATKAVNQVIVAGIAQGVCEALALGEKLELPQDKLIEVLTGGAANSWFLEKRGATMLRDEFGVGFKLGLLLKDLNIAASIGKSLGLVQSVVQQSIADYTSLVAQGRGDEEISALIRRKRAG